MHIRTLLAALLGILAVHSVIIANADEARKTLPLPEIPSISLIQDDLSLFQIETVSIASRYEQPVQRLPATCPSSRLKTFDIQGPSISPYPYIASREWR